MNILPGPDKPLITSIKGYLWFLSLNIIYCAWFLLNNITHAYNSAFILKANTLLCLIIGYSLINVIIAVKLRHTINNGLYHRLLPFIILVLSFLWSLLFINMLVYHDAPAVNLMLITIILLPATIAFYTSGFLLFLFDIPIIVSLIYSESITENRFNLLQMIAMVIILLIVYSARYILMEWYQRVQRSEYEKNVLIKKLTKLAHYDPLTGLNNRRSLTDYFIDGIKSQKNDKVEYFMLLMDIDFFKQYNDYYGHVAGDECLVNISRCIENALRKGSDIAFRYGGEEFIVIAHCNNHQQAQKIAERIQAQIAHQAIPHKGSKVAKQVTMSIGIAPLRSGVSLQDWLESADRQLYNAKQSGRNQICHE